MLSIPSTVSIFRYTEPTDMRKSFDGLSGIVRGEFTADSTNGSLFLFINRRRDRLKILHFDGTGYWLFIGSVAAGERAADFFTLVSSAVRNDLDVWAYLQDVLDRLLAGETDYAALRPDTWRQTHPGAIREHRVIERRDRADRQPYRRGIIRSGADQPYGSDGHSRAARQRNSPKPPA